MTVYYRATFWYKDSQDNRKRFIYLPWYWGCLALIEWYPNGESVTRSSMSTNTIVIGNYILVYTRKDQLKNPLMFYSSRLYTVIHKLKIIMARDYWSNNHDKNKRSLGFYIWSWVLLELSLVPMIIDIIFKSYIFSPFGRYILVPTVIVLVWSIAWFFTYKYRFYFYIWLSSFIMLLLLVVWWVFYMNKQEAKLWMKE